MTFIRCFGALGQNNDNFWQVRIFAKNTVNCFALFRYFSRLFTKDISKQVKVYIYVRSEFLLLVWSCLYLYASFENLKVY